MRKILQILIILLPITLFGCVVTNNHISSEFINEKQLFFQGIQKIKVGRSKECTNILTKFNKTYPASVYHSKLLILEAYSYYVDNNYLQAILTINHFLHQYPMHKDVPYMYYIRGISNYSQIIDVERDQKFASNAKKDLQILINSYTSSKYSDDARYKLEYVDNILAGKEMDIGKFYMRINKPIASINRFKNIIKRYQTSVFTPEALYRLIEVYSTLGIKDQAKILLSVLSYNYPKNVWYYKSYQLFTKMDK